MAAGASSPELFSSIVALFITHSALGLGTIVGSEIFNQLVICAGAVYSSRTGKLQLDKAIVTREVGFYALAIVLLYLSLQDTRPDPDDPKGGNHIYISFADSAVIFAGYIFYVLVCANMETIVRWCASCRTRFSRNKRYSRLSNNNTFGGGDDDIPVGYGAAAISQTQLPDVGRDLPFLAQASLMKGEPEGNFVRFYHTTTGEKAAHRRDLHDAGAEDDASTRVSAQPSLLEKNLRRMVSAYSDGNTLQGFDFLLHADKPSDEHGLYDIEVNSFEERFSCFLWQRSYFYTKARFAMRGWRLRWFSLTPTAMYSVPDRCYYEQHRVKYPPFKTAEVDNQRLIIRLINPEAGKRDFYLMAPSDEILQAFVQKLESMIASRQEEEEKGQREEIEMEAGDANFESGDDHVDLVAFPLGASNSMEIVFFVLLLPLRYLMHWTVPDVRKLDRSGNPVGTLSQAYLAIVACLVWLIIGSYAMVASLEALAVLMDIPDAVVGFTVAAAGTSLPNYVASKVAAQNGFGVSFQGNTCGVCPLGVTNSVLAFSVTPEYGGLECLRQQHF